MVTDANGNLVAQLGHYPFGEAWYNTSSDKLLFTTYSRDAESGNDYAMARSYVNRVARFASADPLSGTTASPQSLNRYAYTVNEPIDLIDPSGLSGRNPMYGPALDTSNWNNWLFELMGNAASGQMLVSDGSYTLVSADFNVWAVTNTPGLLATLFDPFPPGVPNPPGLIGFGPIPVAQTPTNPAKAQCQAQANANYQQKMQASKQGFTKGFVYGFVITEGISAVGGCIVGAGVGGFVGTLATLIGGSPGAGLGCTVGGGTAAFEAAPGAAIIGVLSGAAVYFDDRGEAQAALQKDLQACAALP